MTAPRKPRGRRYCRGTGIDAPDGARRVMCPFCGSNIRVRRDGRLFVHGKYVRSSNRKGVF